jgi:3-oxoadipate enol-lactonase
MTAPAQRHYGPAVPAPALRVNTSDGCTLSVRVLRQATSQGAIPVLFIHALAMDGDMWSGVAQVLGNESWMVDGAFYAVDCRGHGASDAPTGPYTTARFAQDVQDVLDAIGSKHAHVVGCSMGGTVALALAGIAPERLTSLTVIDCSAWYGTDAPTRWETRAQTALTEGMAALVEFQIARWFSPEFAQAEPALVRQSVAVFSANHVPAYAESCRMLGQADERPRLHCFTGPVSVVVGAEDYATPITMGQDIVDRMTDARLTVVPGTRHYTPLEAPDAIASCIANTLARATSITPKVQDHP